MSSNIWVLFNVLQYTDSGIWRSHKKSKLTSDRIKERRVGIVTTKNHLWIHKNAGNIFLRGFEPCIKHYTVQNVNWVTGYRVNQDLG